MTAEDISAGEQPVITMPHPLNWNPASTSGAL